MTDQSVNPQDSQYWQQHQANPNVVHQGDPTLPPAGYTRDEALKARTDQLQQQIAQQPEQYSIDPSKIEPIREIQYEIEHNMLDVPNRQPGYVYRWVQCQYPSTSPGLKVQEALVRRIRINGASHPAWEVVTGNHPEASGMSVTAENTIRIGDTILMRCRKDIHAVIELETRKKNHLVTYGTDANMVQLAEELTRKGYPTSAGHKAYNKYFNDANQVLRTSESELDRMIRNGTLPGLQVPQ